MKWKATFARIQMRLEKRSRRAKSRTELAIFSDRVVVSYVNMASAAVVGGDLVVNQAEPEVRRAS